MAFKDTQAQLQLIDLSLIEPDPAHPRKHFEEAGLKGLANSIRHLGLIQPLVVQESGGGRYRVVVGERRRQAALLAGETRVPALVRPCSADEALEVRVFENLGLGVRAPLEPREIANAIQAIAERFPSPEAAAEYFCRPPSWLNQATAAAKLSPKVSALLDSGQISSTTAAIQLEKLAQKNEDKAEALIGEIQEGSKLPKEKLETALVDAGVKRRKKEAAPAPAPAAAAPAPQAAAPAAGHADVPPWEDAPAVSAAPSSPSDAAPRAGRRVSQDKMKMVAELLGLPETDEEVLLARLIDEFLALKGEGNPPF